MARKKTPNGFGSIRKKVVAGNIYYEGRYTDPLLHKQKSVSATTEKECREKLKAIFVKINTGTYVTPKKITVENWAKEWLDGRQNIRKNTYTVHNNNLRNHILPTLGKLQLVDVRPAHCQAIVRDLTAKKLSPLSVQSAVSTLRKMMDDAVRLEAIASNPAANLELPKAEKKTAAVLLPSERTAFFAAIKDDPYEAIFLTCLHTGARIGEVLGLSWDCVDFDAAAITIDKQLDTRAKKLTATKTGNIRTVYIPDSLVAVLKNVRRTQMENRMKAGSLWQRSSLVYTDKIGRCIDYSTVKRHFKQIVETIGRTDLTIHSLRHTYATDEIASGVDPKTVADSLGHATTAMTMDIYAVASVDKKIAAAKRRDEEFSNSN